MKKIKSLSILLVFLSLFLLPVRSFGQEQTITLTMSQYNQLMSNLNKRKEINNELRNKLNQLQGQLEQSQQELSDLKNSTVELQVQLSKLRLYSMNQTDLLNKTKESYEKLMNKQRQEIGIKLGSSSKIDGISYTYSMKILGSVYGLRGEYDWEENEPSLWLVYQY